MKKSPGQPITPSDLDLAPANGFQARTHYAGQNRADAQRRAMTKLTEGLRTIGLMLTRKEVKQAHVALDVLAFDVMHNSARMADLHLIDAGVRIPVANELAKYDIHTMQDLSACDPTKLCRTMDILDVLNAMRAALRRVVELERAG